MNCSDARPLVDAWMDGELELGRQLEVEGHLEGCAACSRLFEARRATQSALRAGGLYFRAPAGLKRRIEQSRRGARDPRAVRWPGLARSRWTTIGLATAAVLVIAVSALLWTGSDTRARDVVAQQIVSSHVRSLQPGHLLDVTSSDQHTVKPWFAGKIDFSPPVVDMRDRGFPLAGGRLDSIDGRTVAALVYHRRQHTINVFVWPSTVARRSAALQVRGFNLVQWSRDGLEGWAVSDLNAKELEQFTRSLLAELGRT